MWPSLLALVLAQAPSEPAAPTTAPATTAPTTTTPAAAAPATAPATTAPTTAPATTAPAIVEAAPRILVLVPKGDTVDVEVRRAIAATLTVELGKTGRFTALSSSELAQLADLEADKQAAGCDSTSCLGEIAGALGARYVVVGDATQLGDLLVVNLSLFDVERATSVQRTSFEVNDPADVPARARAAAAALAGTGSARAPAAGLPLVPLTLLVTGGALALGGLAFDLLSPTSNNRALDAGDVVGPVAMTGGATAIVVGVVLWGAP